jgi:methylglyoxal/glyoxal reductase
VPQTIPDTRTLNNGVEMPVLGLGTYQADQGGEVEQAVQWALELGYRSIDTASVYENEVGVGRALRESGVPREEIFLTSKVWNDDQGFNDTLQAFQESLERLQVDYLDLYLVHWPVKGEIRDTWRALETIADQGRACAIGVSNFLQSHLTKLLETAEVKPAVNQIEFHPRLQQPELVAVLCRARYSG